MRRSVKTLADETQKMRDTYVYIITERRKEDEAKQKKVPGERT